MPLTIVEHAGRAGCPETSSREHEDRRRGLFGGLFSTIAVACRESGGDLPGRHQDGEVPRDDLAHDAKGFVGSDRPTVSRRSISPTSCPPGCAGPRRNSGNGRFASGMSAFVRLADRLAVVPGFGLGERGRGFPRSRSATYRRRFERSAAEVNGPKLRTFAQWRRRRAHRQPAAVGTSPLADLRLG